MPTTTADPKLPDAHAMVPVERVQAVATIENAADAQAAATYLRQIRQAIRRIKAHYVDVRRPVNEALKDLKRQEEEKLAPFLIAEEAVDGPLISWRLADKQRVEQERRAQLAEAREVEVQRREVEVNGLLKAAEQAKGTERTILKMQARALQVAPVTPRITEPVAEETKLAGVPLVEYWSADVRDLALLVQAVAAGHAPLSAIQPNQKWLDEQANAFRAELSYPGVVAVVEYGQRARGL